MIRYLKYILAFLFVFSSALLCQASDDVSVYAYVEKDGPIYAGFKFNFHIVVEGSDSDVNVNIDPLSMYSPAGPSVSNQSNSSITIINGKKTVEQTQKYVYSYSLTAPAQGSYLIPSLNVFVEGQKYLTDPVDLVVHAPDKTNGFDFVVTLSSDRCYVGQPIVLEARWYIWMSLAGAVRLNGFSVPLLSDQDFAFEQPSADEQDPQGRFSVSGQDVYLYQSQQSHNGVDCVVVYFRKIVIPLKEGNYSFDPSIVFAKIPIQSNSKRNRFFNDIFEPKTYKVFSAESQPLSLNVVPVPAQSKPDFYNGLVGRYSIETSASPLDVKVGDPITLKIAVGGNDYLGHVEWPILDKISELNNNFIITQERAAPTIEGGKKVFVLTIRANNDSVTEIPPIPLVYFDVDAGGYEIAKSAPIPIQVSPNRILTLGDVEGINKSGETKELVLISNGLSANYEGSDLLIDEKSVVFDIIRSPIYLVMLALSIFVLILSSLIKIYLRNDPVKQQIKKQKNAAAKAVRLIKKIKKSHDDSARQLLAAALKSYISDKFSKNMRSLTASDCMELLCGCSADEATHRFCELLEQCEASEYSPSHLEYDAAWTKEAIKLILKLESNIK